MQQSALFLETFSSQPPLVRRLASEIIEATREFRESPKEFLASAIRGEHLGGPRRKTLFRLGLAAGVVLYSIFFGTMLLMWTFNTRPAPFTDKETEYVVILIPLYSVPAISMPKSEKEGHGGGGGGDGKPDPASWGAPPPFSQDPLIIAPTTRPTLQPPSIPILERLLGDPTQNTDRDRSIPTGLPDGVIGPPSDGPGMNKGIGTGDKGGVGPGEGPGFDLGKDGGKGGGVFSPGGKREPQDITNIVDTRPVALNEPRPNYTEEARKNKLQGIVRARILVGSDGLVKQIRIIRGLPDGLNEEAIRAASQMRFKPAMKQGQAVAYWTTLDVEFNLR